MGVSSREQCEECHAEEVGATLQASPIRLKAGVTVPMRARRETVYVASCPPEDIGARKVVGGMHGWWLQVRCATARAPSISTNWHSEAAFGLRILVWSLRFPK